MATNFCSEHGTVWFKKGKMRGFAHPLEGGGWCNQPEDWVEPEVTEPKATTGHVEIQPQERGMWCKELGEMIRCGMLTRDTILGEKKPVAAALYNAYWAGMFVGMSIKVEKKDG